MRKNKAFSALYNLILSALFAALIAVFTAFVSIKTGINDGYLHFGDSLVYLAACILPLPYAPAAAAVGGALADVLGGAAVWAPFSAVIKALNTLPFALVYACRLTKSPQRILNKATAWMPLASGLITILGYFLAEGLLYSFPTAAVSCLASLVQAAGSAVLYYAAAAALDRVQIKKRLHLP